MPPRFRAFVICTPLFLIAAAGVSPAAMPGPALNVNPEQIAAHGDILAWSLLGVLGVTLGMVTACGLGIYRQFRSTTPEARLLEEIKRRSRPSPAEPPALPVPPAAGNSWERPADWWKVNTPD